MKVENFPIHFNLIIIGKIFSILLLISACSAPLKEKKETDPNMHDVARVYQTAQSTTDRLTQVAELSLMKDSFQNLPYVNVDTTKKFQSIIGFGGAFTESSAYNFYNMSEVKRKQIIEMYFDKVKGIGYTFGRVHINSCDFSLESWACDTVPGDTLLTNFNIERDKKQIIPFVKEAKALAGNDFKLFASPWSPPKWMKTNNDMCHGGQLKPEYRSTWALYYTKFIKAYTDEGLPIWGITVQNEPAASQSWESCLYSADEERDFVKNHLGPTLEREGLSAVKLIVWDHNRDIMFERATTILNDPGAAKYVWGTGMHWYVGDHFDNITALHEAYPDKHIIFTEGCQEAGPHFGEWQVGERYGKSVINDLNRNTEAWTDWNLILDMQGGPNHVGNYCSAPMHVDGDKDSLTINNSYYYLGHFSKFIRPGARRIISSSTKDEFEVTAFLNIDNTIAIVVMNRSDNDIEFALRFYGKAGKTRSLAHSIITYVL